MKISDLVNKVEPFKFEYDGFVLEGEWYKFRTTTFAYGKALDKTIPDIPDGLNDEQKAEALKNRVDALERATSQVLTDTIKSWNAEDDQGNPLPPSKETFETLPEPFTKAFLAFINDLRQVRAQNPPLPNSPSS